mgnify:CR=1 FL=1
MESLNALIQGMGLMHLGAGQAVMLLEGMQRARATRCGVPAGEVSLLPPGANAPHGAVAQTFLVCPGCPTPTLPRWRW